MRPGQRKARAAAKAKAEAEAADDATVDQDPDTREQKPEVKQDDEQLSADPKADATDEAKKASDSEPRIDSEVTGSVKTPGEKANLSEADIKGKSLSLPFSYSNVSILSKADLHLALVGCSLVIPSCLAVVADLSWEVVFGAILIGIASDLAPTMAKLLAWPDLILKRSRHLYNVLRNDGCTNVVSFLVIYGFKIMAAHVSVQKILVRRELGIPMEQAVFKNSASHLVYVEAREWESPFHRALGAGYYYYSRIYEAVGSALFHWDSRPECPTNLNRLVSSRPYHTGREYKVAVELASSMLNVIISDPMRSFAQTTDTGKQALVQAFRFDLWCTSTLGSLDN